MSGSPERVAPAPPSEARWWGWGGEHDRPQLPASAAQTLVRTLGATGSAPPPATLDQVRLPERALPAAALASLAAAVGEGHVDTGREARVRHAGGKSYPDLVRLRAGDGSCAPDAVVRPASAAEVAAVLDACAEHEVAVVPFGGGTSVVGGVEAVREGFAGVVTLDLARLDRLLSVDRRSLTATLEAGVPGWRAERLLADQGLTLGHFPQSYEYATIGGYVATRSAGQASTGYGRSDEMVLGLRCQTPAGELRTRPWPGTAAGPALRELVVGSEGVLGVITEATLAVRARPETRRYEAWSFRSFAEGAECFRALEQGGHAPDVARLSDEQETALTFAAAGSSVKQRAARRYLRLRGHAGGCLAIVGWEGSAAEVRRRRAASALVLRAGGGVPLGTGAGEAWARGRYGAPYLRDDLLGLGVLTETLETATTWSGLLGLHAAVREAIGSALAARGTPAVVGCHVSHLYPSGASLYFTFLARQETGAELDQWRAAKTAAGDAIVAAGGTITHHHAVGRDHRPWMRAEVGELGLEVLRAAKARLDPAGIMNPGKLLP